MVLKLKQLNAEFIKLIDERSHRREISGQFEPSFSESLSMGTAPNTTRPLQHLMVHRWLMMLKQLKISSLHLPRRHEPSKATDNAGQVNTVVVF